jgi:hypothetical protein
VVGNESDRHIRYKQKVANILRRNGYTCFGDHDDEIAIQCDADAPAYYLDICALYNKRVIVCEIDGYTGHKSQRAIYKDKHRTTAIIKYFKKQGLAAEVYRFAFWQLKGMDDDTIKQELQLC